MGQVLSLIIFSGPHNYISHWSSSASSWDEKNEAQRVKGLAQSAGEQRL